MNMQPTIFTKIINREIPATIIDEDELSISFLDIQPVSLGHTLLIPKEQYKWMQDVPDELLTFMWKRTKNLMIKMKDGLGCDYVQISVVGKDIPHFHIHLIPRYFNDGLKNFETLTYENKEQMGEIANKIRG